MVQNPCPQTLSKKPFWVLLLTFLNTLTQQKMSEALALYKVIIFKIRNSATVTMYQKFRIWRAPSEKWRFLWDFFLSIQNILWNIKFVKTLILLQKEFYPVVWRRRWEAEFSNRRLKINCFCNNTILLQVLGDILSKKENRPKIIVLSLNIMIFIFSGKKFNFDSPWRILN